MSPHAPTTDPALPGTTRSSPPPPDPRTRSPYPDAPLGTATQPPLDPPRPRRALRHRPNLNRPLLLAGTVGATFAVATPGSPLRSVGWALALTVLIGASVTTSARRPASVWLGLSGAAFVPWLGIRMSPWLTVVNLVVAAGLVLASLGLPAAGSLRVTVVHHLARVARAVGGFPVGPSHLAHDLRRGVSVSTFGGLRRLLPSIVVGVTALAAGLAILASGDALLASYFDLRDLAGETVVRSFAAACGIAAFAALIGAIHVPGSTDAAPRPRSAPALPTLFGIGGLAIAIGAYSATQISAALLGADYVKSRTGLTYAEYARGGFFQMVIVACVSVAVIGIARGAVRTEPEAAARMRVGAATLTVGVVVTVVSAVVKLAVYADTFGLTMLRVYTVVFACWLGLVALMSFATLLRPSATWFAPVLLASMCLGAFSMNVANPEKIVVEHNLDRATSTGELDVGYLSSLSLDAAPVVFARLAAIDAVYDDRSRSGSGPVDAAAAMERIWCGKVADAAGGGLAFNVARNAARDAADPICE